MYIYNYPRQYIQLNSSKQGAILFNDEVHFKDVTHSHPPSATSAGRLALKVVPTRAKRSMELGHNAEAEGLRNYRTWDDESVWAALPYVCQFTCSTSRSLLALLVATSNYRTWDDEGVWAALPCVCQFTRPVYLLY